MLRFLFLLALLLPFQLDAQSVSVPMDANLWFAEEVGSNPKAAQGDGFVSFDFPQTDSNLVGRFMVQYKKPITVSGTLCATFQISTTPANPPNLVSFDYPCGPTDPEQNICGYGPYTEFYLEQKGWDRRGAPASTRWWATNKFTLADTNGQTTLCTPLTRDNWTCVFPNDPSCTTDAFNIAIQQLEGWGWSQGGGYWDGHAVSVSNGSASFKLFIFGTQ